jgi:serine/threonine protein kinase
MIRKLHFELVRLLDSGGRGDVYLGYVREMNLWVAVKYLRESHIPQQRQAFFREIDTLLKGIPGMIRILDFNKVADVPYYVMEYYSPTFISDAVRMATISPTTSS